jgi:ubiquitin-like 1-activating enzyme E1 A
MTTNNNAATNKPTESDVYDRQIRLWGAEAQKKMQSSRVLYIHVTGSSSEVLKNLCLAGIKAEICDTRPASALDASPCFFTHPNNTNNTSANEGEGDQQEEESPTKKIKYDSVAHAVRPLVEELNPLLGSCPIVEKDVAELTQEDLKDYAVVIASRIPIDEAVRISQLLAKCSNSCVFYTIDCFGMRGASMIDFGTASDFRYRPEQGKKLLDPIPLKETVSLLEMAKVPLHKAINRFHKKGPPPTWVMYRAILEHQKQTGTWLGDAGVETAAAKTLVAAFLKEQQSSLSDDELEDLVTAGMAQVAPVCAVLGGMVGNEVIKIISGKGEPANNTLLLDGGACKAWTFLVKAKE